MGQYHAMESRANTSGCVFQTNPHTSYMHKLLVQLHGVILAWSCLPPYQTNLPCLETIEASSFFVFLCCEWCTNSECQFMRYVQASTGLLDQNHTSQYWVVVSMSHVTGLPSYHVALKELTSKSTRPTAVCITLAGLPLRSQAVHPGACPQNNPCCTKPGSMSAQQTLDQVLRNPDTCLNPPAMDEMFTESYEEKLVGAIKAAIASGMPPGLVYCKVRGWSVGLYPTKRIQSKLRMWDFNHGDTFFLSE